MGAREIADDLYDISRGPIEATGVVLIDVEMVPGRRVLFRFVIDADGGATIDDCVKVTRVVRDFLDEWERAPENYRLEVTSPGLDRRLRRLEEYEHFRGRPVRLHADVDGEGVREFSGVLGGLDGEDVVLEADGETVRIPAERIGKARLLFEGPGDAASGRKR